MHKYDRDPWHNAETVPLWFFISIVIVLLATFLLTGCPKPPSRTLLLDLINGKFESTTVNSEIEVGSIHYKETNDPNGVVTIELKIESYKVASDRVAMERDKAMMENVLKGAATLGAAAVGAGVLP